MYIALCVDITVMLVWEHLDIGGLLSPPRAMVCKATGDHTMAIVNFTQAIKLNPEDYEAYYQRAEMYESVS